MQASQAGQQMPRESAQGAGQVPLHVLDSTYAEESSLANLSLLSPNYSGPWIAHSERSLMWRKSPCSARRLSCVSSRDPCHHPSSQHRLNMWLRRPREAVWLRGKFERCGPISPRTWERRSQLGDLAALVRLSRFHFSRAFKDTFGDTPHRYVLRRRIEHAQGLMLTTKTTLAEIALECGLVDQAHLGRSFRRIVGETPAAWRRARMAGV